MTEPVILRERAGGPFTLDVNNGRHHLYADEPAALGGSDLGPTPFEYLCAALGSCTLVTLRMYARRKDIEIGELSITVTHSYRKTSDGQTQNVFTRLIDTTADLDEAEEAKILEIANKCPVHKMLDAGNIIETRMV